MKHIKKNYIINIYRILFFLVYIIAVFLYLQKLYLNVKNEYKDFMRLFVDKYDHEFNIAHFNDYLRKYSDCNRDIGKFLTSTEIVGYREQARLSLKNDRFFWAMNGTKNECEYVLKYYYFPEYLEKKLIERIDYLKKNEEKLKLLNEILDIKEYVKLNENDFLQIPIKINEYFPTIKNDFEYLSFEEYKNGEDENKNIVFKIHIFKHKKTGLIFSLIPGGKYYMKPFEQIYEESYDYQKRKNFIKKNYELKEVIIKPFLLCQTETPERIWENEMGIKGYIPELLGETFTIITENPEQISENYIPNLNNIDFPVNVFRWQKLKAFCAKLKLRLPSESELEYATRSGSTSYFWWGEKDNKENIIKYCWQFHPKINQYCDLKSLNRIFFKIKANELHRNAFGLYDIFCNMEELCEDTYRKTIHLIPDNGEPYFEYNIDEYLYFENSLIKQFTLKGGTSESRFSKYLKYDIPYLNVSYKIPVEQINFMRCTVRLAKSLE